MTEAATTDGMPASERSSGRKRATADYGTRVIDDLTSVAEHRWQALVEASGCGGPHGSSGAIAAAPLADDEDDPAVGGLPFIDWRYLTALEQTGCVGGRSGWAANHLLVERNGELVAAAPLYRKLHSYGEYVFDWAWADAYQRHGLDYYPKGLVASPFTPVPGPRLLAVDDAARDRLLAALVDHAREQQWSSLHLLFPPRAEAAATRRAGWLERRGVQFHWRNPGYRDFDDFLSRLAQPKRKKILAERRKVREAGIRISCHEGPTISAPHWLLFNRCYRTTMSISLATNLPPWVSANITMWMTPSVISILARWLPSSTSSTMSGCNPRAAPMAWTWAGDGAVRSTQTVVPGSASKAGRRARAVSPSTSCRCSPSTVAMWMRPGAPAEVGA